MVKKQIKNRLGSNKKILLPEIIKAPGLRGIFLSLFLIVVVGAIAYSNSLHNPFLWDDHLYIKDNYPVQDIHNIPALFTRNITTLNDNNFYRPLQMLTYTLNYTFSKFDVTTYHLTNIVFHIMVGMSVFWLGLILSGGVFLSAAAGLLFVSHPIHVEAVTYISGRADSMAACFLLWSIISYINYARKKNIYLLILGVLAFSLGLLCKENVVITPLLILAYDYIYHERKFFFWRVLPFFIVGSIYIALRQSVFHFSTSDVIANQTQLLDRIPLIFDSLFMYIKKLILPFHLHMEYPLYIPSLLSIGVFIGVILLGGFLYLLINFRIKEKIVSFSAAWFLIMFVPISNIFPLNAFFYEHWVYTPSVGFFILLGWGIQRLCKINKLIQWLTLLIVGAVLSFNIYLTLKQNYYWSDPELFFKRTLKYNSNSGRVNSELALYYILNNRIDEGIEFGKKALELDPNFYIVNVNLASAYMRKEMIDESIEQSKKAIALRPDSSPAHINLANGYMRKLMFDEAFVEFNKAIEFNSELPEGYNGRAAASIQKGNFAQAISDCTKAIEIKPEYSDAYNNRGVAYDNNGESERAIADYTKSIEIDPQNSLPYDNRGKVYYKMKKYDQALSDFTQAVKVNPKDALAYSIRGLIYNDKHDYDRAILDYSKVIEINPNNGEAYYNRGLAYDLKGETPKALLDYTKSIEINPKEPLAYNNRGAIYVQMNNFDQGLDDFTKAIEVNPLNAEAYNNRGTVYSRKSDYDRALIDYNKAVELNTKYPDAYGNLALAYFLKADYDKAWENLHKAQSLGHKVNPNFLQNLQKSSGRQE